MARDPKAQRLKALATYQVFKAQAKAAFGEAAVAQPGVIDVIAKTAVLASASKQNAITASIKSTLLEATAVETGMFFFLFSLDDQASTSDAQLLGVLKGILDKEVLAVDLALRSFGKTLADQSLISDQSLNSFGKSLNDPVGASEESVTAFSKRSLDIAATSDNRLFSVAKPVEDQFDIADLTILGFGKRIEQLFPGRGCFRQDSVLRSFLYRYC